MAISEALIGRYPNTVNEDLIQITGAGGGVLWRLSQMNTVWFSGTGAPSGSAFPGALSGNLYLDTASGNVWQFNGSTWIEVEVGGAAYPTPNWLNVKTFGAVGNGRWDNAIGSGKTVTLQNKLFAQSDVGKPILLTGGAATSGQVSTGPGSDLWTTITAVAANGLSCTVAATISAFFPSSVGNAAPVFWGGTDDTTAIQNAINAASESQAILYFPPGVYIYSKQLTNTGSDLAGIVGDGPGVSILLAQNPAVASPTGCLLITSQYAFQMKNLWVRGPSSYTTVGYTAEVEIEQSTYNVSGFYGTSGAENIVASDCYAIGLYLYVNSSPTSFPVPTSLVNCHGVHTPNGGLSALTTGPLTVSGCSDTGQMYFRAYSSAGLAIHDCFANGGIIAPDAVLTGCVITSTSQAPLITSAFEGSKFSFCALQGGNWTNGFYQSNAEPLGGGPTFISSFDHCECDFVQHTGAVSVFFNADMTQGDVSLLSFRDCKVALVADISQPNGFVSSPVQVSTGIHDTSVSDTGNFSPTNTTGNALIFGVITSGSGTSTISDGFNTYNQIGSTISVGTYNLQYFLALNAHARSTFTITPSAGVALATYIEMQGLPTSSAVDGTLQSTTGTVGAGGTISLPITTSQNDDYVVSMAFVSASTGTAVTQKSPFLGPVLSPASAVGIMSMGSAVAPKAGVATAAWGLAGQSTADYAILNLALKVTASQYPATTSYLINAEGSNTDFSTQVLFENCTSTISLNSASLHLQATNVSTPGSTKYAYGTPPGGITLINFMAYDFFTGALTPPANGFNLNASNTYFLNSQANTQNASLTNGSTINGIATAGSSGAVNGTPVSILPLDSPTNSGVSNKTGQVGSISSTPLVSVAAGDSGLWRISFYEECTSAGSGGTATPAFTWTDENGSESLTYGSSLALTGTGYLANSVMVHAVGGSSGSTIAYSVAVAGASGSPVYSSFVSAERIS
jgi:hypothetical protein